MAASANGTMGDMEEPLLQGHPHKRSSHVEHEVPPSLIAYEHEHRELYKRGAHWLQTTSALLALQLGWGLWLMPADFARLGWYTSAGCLVTLAVLTGYSGFLFARLYTSTPGAVLFGDIGYSAAGSFGRNIVYAIIYSLDGTRCVILHLAASQSLRHIFPEDSMPPLWQCGAVVLVLAGLLVQIRSLARLTWVFSAGTGSQLIAIAIVLYELLRNPDPDAEHEEQAVTSDSLVPASVALMNMIFAFGGQFAFVEIMSSMQRPTEFPQAITVCTILMGSLYAAVGAAGYYSRGSAITGIIIFDLGHSPIIRVAAACILLQALSQYLVNLNVWTHNLLVLIGRSFPDEHFHLNSCNGSQQSLLASRSNSVEGQASLPDPQCSDDHCPWRWLVASAFVVFYSYLISTTVPYFGTLVGLVTSSTYLLCAYGLPAWFTLRLMGDRLSAGEAALLWALIPFSLLFSGVGLYGSVVSLVQDIQGGGEGGWSR